MTEKRFKYHMGLICEKRDEEYNLLTIKEVTDLLNKLHEENEQLKRINKRCSDSHLRMRNRLERLHKDWDKLWDICKDKGMTDEEIIKEMER